ncbi:MAG: MotA/TolQ/ExbB proton channel family protein [Candidatus Dadabacteria bacterium]|nr:MAG: MotA/TolQ/ExbB proton channel family protein [Candidatus Dadabacteria bacterium]
MQSLNLIELIQQGWIATYPLILFSVVMVAILGERMFALSGVASATRRLTGQVVPPLTRGDIGTAISVCNKHRKSLQARIYHSILADSKTTDPLEASEKLEENRYEETQDLKRNIWILGTIGSSAPFIGLFGTVVGIIKSFHSMSIAGTGGFSVVAGGISEALVATAAGLVVAIIAVIAYNYLQVRVAAINAELRINHAKFFHALKQGRINDGSRQA